MARNLTAALAIILLFSAFAYADQPGSAGGAAASVSSGSLWVSPATLKAGDKVVVKGAGFTPGGPVVVELITAFKKAKGAITANLSSKAENGSIVELICNEYSAFKLEIKIPKSIVAGVYTLQAEDETGIKATVPLEIIK
jgi:hypothetical protein